MYLLLRERANEKLLNSICWVYHLYLCKVKQRPFSLH